MIPTVGTTATSHFVRNVVRKHKVTDATAIAMLVKLPMHVKIPSERLLLEMEDLLKLGSTVSTQVRKASILCFSILIRKTFMHQHSDVVNPLLERYLHRFLDHVKSKHYNVFKYIKSMQQKWILYVVKYKYIFKIDFTNGSNLLMKKGLKATIKCSCHYISRNPFRKCFRWAIVRDENGISHGDKERASG